MKRLATFIAFLLLFSFAAAEDLPQGAVDFVNRYNAFADSFSVPCIPLDGWEYGINYSIVVDNLSFSLDPSFDRIFVTVLSDHGIDGDFFAVCACLTAAARGDSPENYSDILTIYFALRNTPPGENATLSSGRKMMIMKQQNGLVIFGVTD